MYILIRNTILILLCQFIFTFRIIAQEAKITYPFKHYSIHDGLVQMQVQALYQDSKGYLWCGTKTGISRFDGKEFKNYSGIEIKQTSPVTFFDEDEQGNLLVFNHQNLSILSDDTVYSVSYPQNTHISEMLSKPFKHSYHKLCRIKLVHRSLLYQNAILDYTNIDSMTTELIGKNKGNIIFDPLMNDHVWLIHTDSVFQIDLKTKQRIKTFKNQNFDVIQSLNGQLYAFSKTKGIFIFENDSLKNISPHNFNNSYLIVIPIPDQSGFIISDHTDLYLFRKGQLHLIKGKLALVRDMLFDKEENLWVATEEGLYNFFKLNFVNYTFGMGNKDWVWSITEDVKKNMWFTSFQNGIWKWDGKKITTYTDYLNQQKRQLHNIQYNYTYFMGSSNFKNTVYFTTNYNVITFNGNNFNEMEGTPKIWNKAYFFTKTISDGTFYCGGMPGLTEILKTGKTKTWSAENLGISTIMNAEIDNNKTITAIGNEGIARINNDTVVIIDRNSLQKNYCSITDHRGNIWIGGNNTLKLLSGDSVTNVVNNNDEQYFSLLFKEPYYLFIGGLKGLSLVNLEDFYKNNLFEPVLYNHHNGFMGTECGQNGFFTDSEGYTWINTSDMVTRFDPNRLINDKSPPPALYLKSEMSEKNITWTDVSERENDQYPNIQNNFRFTLNTIALNNPENIHYYYKLEGLHSEWSAPSSNNEITFYNLKPGNYNLQARADAGTNDTISEIVSFSFCIKKPFWQTWWFISCLVLFLVLIMTIIIILFNRKTRKQELIKKRIIQLRADALKAQMNPHLIYNALNNINGLINLGEKEKAQQHLNAFSDMLRLVFASTNKQEITLANELEIVKSFVCFHQQTNALHFDFIIDSQLNSDATTILVPPIVIQPFIENAILHGFSRLEDRRGKLHLNLKNTNTRLIIEIQDNGIGIGNSRYKGNGIGTKLTYERMQLLEKKPEKQVKITKLVQGTKVVINIPLKLI